MDYYLTEILIMANTFVPMGCVAANGATLSLQQYTAMFALMGVTYGGNGSTTFMVPDLCGRVPIGMGLSQRDRVYNYTQGEYGGQVSSTLTSNQLTPHSHVATFTPTGADVPTPVTVTIGVNSDAPGTTTVANPKGNVIAKGVDNSNNALKNFSNAGATATSFLGGVTVTGGGGITGGTVENSIAGLGQPFPLLQPYVVINYCLCVNGIFPTHE